MNTLRLAALAALMLAAACGGAAESGDDPSLEYSGDDTVEPSPEPAAVEPSPSAPSDEPSPATRDDVEPTVVEAEPTPLPTQVPQFVSPFTTPEPTPEPEPEVEVEPTVEPEPEVGLLEGGDVCTSDEQCVEGLVCAEVQVIVPGGYLTADERRCGYVAP